MESSKEKIEAQLCAYIDGELNDAERSEIERHLASNPQHKSLIAELRRHSGLLQDLPRASAPLELNEALCGQLERSALLNAPEEGGSTGLSINRWPQITAVAAVLILAIGLGIVVYYVLPPSGAGTRTPLALDEKKSHQPTTDGVAPSRDLSLSKQTAKSDSAESKGVALGKRSVSDNVTLNVQPEFDPAMMRAGEIKDGKLVTAREVDELRKRANLSLQAGNPGFNLDNASLCLVVSASDTTAANHQVAAFFESNQIRYMKYDDSVADSESPAIMARKSASDVASKVNSLADDHAKDAYANRGNVTEPPAPVGPVGFGGGGGLSGGGRGGKGGDGSAVQSGEKAYDLGRQDEKKDLEQARQEDALAKSKLEAGVSRGMAKPAQAPTTVATGVTPAKPGALTESAKVPAERESRSMKEDRDKTDPSYRQAYGEEKDKREDMLREKEAAKKIASPTFGGPAAENGSLAAGASQQTWEMKDRAARARIAERLADNQNERNGVIIARMNRRQANQLQAVLSREQGQRAELTMVNKADGSSNALAYEYRKEMAASSLGAPAPAGSADTTNKPGAPLTAANGTIDAVASDPARAAAIPKTSEPTLDAKAAEIHGSRKFGMEATQPAANLSTQYKDADARRETDKASEGLRIKSDPLDEPVDVFILVKGDVAGSAGPIQLNPPKAGGEVAPANNEKK